MLLAFVLFSNIILQSSGLRVQVPEDPSDRSTDDTLYQNIHNIREVEKARAEAIFAARRTTADTYLLTANRTANEPFCDEPARYCTPLKLSRALSKQYVIVGQRIRQLDFPSMQEIIKNIQKVDLTTAGKVPFFNHVTRYFERSCVENSLDAELFVEKTGEKAIGFPYCLIHYYTGLHALQNLRQTTIMKKHGDLLRDVVNHHNFIESLTKEPGNVCLPIQQMLALPSDWCEELHDILLATMFAQMVAAKIEDIETQKFEDVGVNLLEVGPKNGRARSLPATKNRTRIAMLNAWSHFALKVFREETKYLMSYWYLDQTHKWRYATGIVNWIVTMGVFIGHLQDKLNMGVPVGEATHFMPYIREFMLKEPVKDYQQVGME